MDRQGKFISKRIVNPLKLSGDDFGEDSFDDLSLRELAQSDPASTGTPFRKSRFCRIVQT